MSKADGGNELAIVQGDFFTDGKKFVFRLAGTSLSGAGDTPTAAFEDLMRVEAETAPLSTRMRELAREQQGEKVRAEIVRMAMIGLIVFGVVGGALAASVAVAPRVMADIGGMALSRVSHSLDSMSPEREAELAHAFQRIHHLVDGEEGPAASAPSPGCTNNPAAAQRTQP
ncbi:MAG: hypothetical protein AB7O04_16545 [Hyphomonadaceae bacterium]